MGYKFSNEKLAFYTYKKFFLYLKCKLKWVKDLKVFFFDCLIIFSK